MRLDVLGSIDFLFDRKKKSQVRSTTCTVVEEEARGLTLKELASEMSPSSVMNLHIARLVIS